ncbi:MAG: oxidoreductase domain protein [Gemmatimonadales bacterium]|nr:oxidoreductase domain protein [Gemmatimonadales bacterium]
MKQVLIQRGRAVVEQVPAPSVEDGTVVVRLLHSCISIGTEMAGVRLSGMPLWKRALSQPEQVRQVLDSFSTQGLRRTWEAVNTKVSAGSPTGYSGAGIVAAIGKGIEDLAAGDLVAVAGAQCAYHAQLVRVPRNLVVPVPAGVSSADASTVALGAIALQGIRRASPTLGETFVVVGLGILGQLTVQMLRANGCRAIGVDLHAKRVELAESLGLEASVHPNDGSELGRIAQLTGGVGADGVIITAASPSDEIVSTAFKMCRKKGRVVLVGDVGLGLHRADFYTKEIDFLISASYGPGRYDRGYEEGGLDYPVAYVRWTENRNMSAYLDLIADGQVRVAPLVSAVHSIDEADEAYRLLQETPENHLMVLLAYPSESEATPEPSRIWVSTPRKSDGNRKKRLQVAVIGAGSYAKASHLVNLRAMSDRVVLRAVVSRSGHNAIETGRHFGATYATTIVEEVLADPEVDVVLIATPHDQHGRQVLAALHAGKHVFVEKPLALTSEMLDAIEAFYRSVPANRPEPPLLHTGYNRRFAPHVSRLVDLLSRRTNPMLINYRMNAGYVPLSHWIHGAAGGGRNLGEACHIYDLFGHLAGSPVRDVTAMAMRPATGHFARSDNFSAMTSFGDGTVATLSYTAAGHRDHPKEVMDVFVDGKVYTLDDYRQLRTVGTTGGMKTSSQDKGQRHQLDVFVDAVREGGRWPISLEEQLQASRIALSVQSQIE